MAEPHPTSVSDRLRTLPLFRRIGYVPPEVTPLDATVLATLGSLPLRSRYLVEALGSGRNRSRRRGADVEFADYRDYQAGDDLRRVDWRLYARTDRLHVREAVADTPLTLVLLLDVSPSMAYVGEGVQRLSKLDYARALLGAMALLARRQGDACGVGLFADKLLRWHAPGFSSNRLQSIWGTLDAPHVGEHTALASAFGEVLRIAPRRCLFVVASDFYEDVAALAPVFQRLRADRHDFIGLRVLDPIELDLPFKHAASFVDLETGQKVAADAAIVRREYKAAVAEHAAQLRDLAVAHGAAITLLPTDTLPVEALRTFLARRGQRRR